MDHMRIGVQLNSLSHSLNYTPLAPRDARTTQTRSIVEHEPIVGLFFLVGRPGQFSLLGLGTDVLDIDNSRQRWLSVVTFVVASG